jgi:enoyl-CoA hydratase/carnithine racemase
LTHLYTAGEDRAVSGSGEGFVEVRREGAVCVLTLSRERKLNALSTAVEEELREALGGDDVRTSSAVVLAGRGRAFSAGADLDELSTQSPEEILAYYRATGDVYEQVAALPQPTITAIHGYCLGGGLELALATDFRVAEETAVLGFPEVALGIVPSSGGTYRAARLLGPGRAKEAILLRPRIAAAEALALGLVTEVVAEGSALTRALELAQQLAELPALAASVAKQAIEAAAESSRDGALLIERLAYGMLAQTEEARRAARR